MATIIEREAVVGPDGTIEIATPELAPGQRVKVTVEVDGTCGQPIQQEPKRHVIDMLAEMPGHRLFKTAEEVDEYIRQERDSWDR
jgi:hypothetical protein